MASSRGSVSGSLIIGAVFALIVAGCSSPPQTSEAPVEAPSWTESPTSDPAPTETLEARTTIELTDGHLTFEVPESWDAQIHDVTETIIADGSAPQFNGQPAQQAVIANPAETVAFDVFSNIPWPDVAAIDPDEVEVLHVEPLDIGYSKDDADGVWLRAVIGENPEFGEPRPSFGWFDARFEDDQYILVVAPYVARDDLADPEEVGGGMTSFIAPFSEATAGSWWEESITIAAGTINQTAAEKLTGLEGLAAMQALVETEEYQHLVDVVSSFQVHVGE